MFAKLFTRYDSDNKNDKQLLVEVLSSDKKIRFVYEQSTTEHLTVEILMKVDPDTIEKFRNKLSDMTEEHANKIVDAFIRNQTFYLFET